MSPQHQLRRSLLCPFFNSVVIHHLCSQVRNILFKYKVILAVYISWQSLQINHNYMLTLGKIMIVPKHFFFYRPTSNAYKLEYILFIKIQHKSEIFRKKTFFSKQKANFRESFLKFWEKRCASTFKILKRVLGKVSFFIWVSFYSISNF